VWEGLRNAAPYLLAGVGAAVLGLGARYLCVRWVSGRKELLTLVTLGVIFGSYALVFRRHLGDLWKVFLARATPISERGTSGEQG